MYMRDGMIQGLKKMGHKKIIIISIVVALVVGILFFIGKNNGNKVDGIVKKEGYYFIDIEGNILNSEPFGPEEHIIPIPFNEDGIAYVYGYVDGNLKSWFMDKNGNVIGGKYFCGNHDYADYDENGINEMKVNMRNYVKFPIIAQAGEDIVVLDENLNQIGRLKDDFGAEDISFFSTDFGNGLAVISIKKDGEWFSGYINSDGDWVLNPQYDKAYPFSEDGIALIKEKGSDLVHFIKEDGSYAIEEGFYDATDFKDGYAMVQKEENGKAAFIDTEGKYITDFIYEFSLDYAGFPEGLARVRLDKDGEYGYINVQGEVVIDPIYTVADDFSCGLAWIGGNEYIDKNGKVVLSGDFWGKSSFSKDGYAIAESRNDTDSRYGIIDTRGEWVLEPQFGTKDSAGLLINEPVYANGYCIAYLEKGQSIKRTNAD